MSRKLLLSAFLIAGSFSSFGQTAHNNINCDAKTLSLGGVSASREANGFAVYNNMAATSFSNNKLEAGISYMNFQPSLTDAKIISIGAYYQLNSKFSLALGYSNETLPSQDKFNDLAEVVENFTPNGYTLTLGVAYRLNKSFSIGLNISNSDVQIDELSENSLMAAIGVYHDRNNLRTGVTINNLGVSNDLILAPTNVRIAGEYDFYSQAKSMITSYLQLGYVLPEEYSQIMAGVGVEYGYNQKYFFRAGYSYGDEAKFMTDYASVGLGVTFSSFCLSTAYLISSEEFGNSLSISLNYKIINHLK